jgi:DNA polymerase III subunit delta
VKANLDQISRALDAPKPETRFFLLHGPDEAGSIALSRRLERAMGADAERVDLDSTGLKADPARLSDEAASFSLFGGKRFIRIHPATEDAVPALDGLLTAAVAENPVVAIAGQLPASSALLKLALDHPATLVFASYAPEGVNADRLAETLAREAGLRIDRDTARAIASASGNDRAIMAQEIEKLALYLDAALDHPREVGSDDYAAISAEANEGGFGSLVEAVMDGRPDQAAQEMARLALEGVSDIPLLRAVTKRVHLLAGLRGEVDRGSSPQAAIQGAGKAIFWKEKDSVARQLARWDSGRLATASTRLLSAERAIKASGSAGGVLADAELIAIARVAARGR